MAQPSEFEARLSAVEERAEVAVADAAAARHLVAAHAGAHDRRLADLAVKVDANRSAINALGVQTAARFDRVDARFEQIDAQFEQINARFEQVDTNFAAVRARLDQTAAGQQTIVEMLTVLIDRQED